MKKSLMIYIGVFLIVIIVLAFLAMFPLKQTIKLNSTEITQYQGKDLSSIQDFRENSIKGPQYIDIKNYTLRVDGLVVNAKNYTYDEILRRQAYSKVVTLNCVEGWSVTILWKGILLKDLLREANPNPEANTIIFHAYDGYTTNYPVDYIMGNESSIIMAYEMNNVTIPPERGFPFMLVAEDKWGYKWIKWITEIEFSNNESYKGFWESRGYSKQGNLNESFFS